MPRGRPKKETTQQIKTAKQQQPTKPCKNCKVLKKLDQFYLSTNPLDADGRSDICRQCANDNVDINDISSIHNMLINLNKPYFHDLWLKSLDESKRVNKNPWGLYLKSCYLNYKDLSWKDGDTNNGRKTEILSSHPPVNKECEYSEEELQELQSFWGKGLSHEDLEFLQREYEKFLNSYECDSYAMELLFQEAAQQRLTIKRLRQEGKSVDKELKTLQDLLGSANIKPAQESGANATEQATFGTLIKKYENERPIPEPDPAWQDVDGIKRYIQVWFLGHLCRMIGINNEYARMYEEELSKHTVENTVYQGDDEEEIGDIK